MPQLCSVCCFSEVRIRKQCRSDGEIFNWDTVNRLQQLATKHVCSASTQTASRSWLSRTWSLFLQHYQVIASVLTNMTWGHIWAQVVEQSFQWSESRWFPSPAVYMPKYAWAGYCTLGAARWLPIPQWWVQFYCQLYERQIKGLLKTSLKLKVAALCQY